MATKAAKSLTINATKFELANALAVVNGKLQLKAKDVVLDEVDAGKTPVSFTVWQAKNRVGIYEQTDGTFPGAGNEVSVSDFITNIKNYFATGGELVIGSENENALQIYFGEVLVSPPGGDSYNVLRVIMYTMTHVVVADYNESTQTWSVTVTLADNSFVITMTAGQTLDTTGNKSIQTIQTQDLIEAVRAGRQIKIIALGMYDSGYTDNEDYILTPATVCFTVTRAEVELYVPYKNGAVIQFAMGITGTTVTQMNRVS